MKTSFNSVANIGKWLLAAFFIIPVLVALMSIFGDFLPTQADGSIVYSQETEDAQGIYDMISKDLGEAKEATIAAKQSLEQAIVVEASVAKTLCAQQLVLSQLKYSDTPSSMENEINRLTESVRQAENCLK